MQALQQSSEQWHRRSHNHCKEGRRGKKSIQVILDPRILFLSKQLLLLAYPMKSLSVSLKLCVSLRILQICLALNTMLLCQPTLFVGCLGIVASFLEGICSTLFQIVYLFPTQRGRSWEKREAVVMFLCPICLFLFASFPAPCSFFLPLFLLGIVNVSVLKHFVHCAKCQLYRLFDSCAASL